MLVDPDRSSPELLKTNGAAAHAWLLYRLSSKGGDSRAPGGNLRGLVDSSSMGQVAPLLVELFTRATETSLSVNPWGVISSPSLPPVLVSDIKRGSVDAESDGKWLLTLTFSYLLKKLPTKNIDVNQILAYSRLHFLKSVSLLSAKTLHRLRPWMIARCSADEYKVTRIGTATLNGVSKKSPMNNITVNGNSRKNN